MAFTLVVFAGISCVVGVLGGLTGTGGILIPPILIEFFSVDPHLATALAQASYCLPSILAVWMFKRERQFDWRLAAVLAIPGCFFNFLSAAYLKPLLGGGVVTILLAAFIVLSGVMTFRTAKRGADAAPDVGKMWPRLAIFASFVGVMAGITGSGSNAILVPVLLYLGFEALPVLAAGQSFSILTSISGTIANAGNMHIDPTAIAALIIGQVVGIWVGVTLAQRMATGTLKRCVGVVCILAGLFILAKTSLSLLG